jgi:hypothetical protein
MPTIVRVRRLTRAPLRLGKTNIANSAAGTAVDLDDVGVKRDFIEKKQRLEIVAAASEGMTNLVDAGGLYAGTDNVINGLTGVQTYILLENVKGLTITSLTFYSGTTAANSPTNQVASLYSSDGTTLTRIATSADALTGAWAADTAKTFNMLAPVATPQATAVYAGLVVAATTAPTLTGKNTKSTTISGLGGVKRAGTAGSGLTNTQASVALSGVTAIAGVPLVKVN